VTPHLGKRKRGSILAQADVDNGDEDELSPDRDDYVRSIEKSRRVVGTVSPVREEIDEVPDELSILEEGASTVRNTPATVSAMTNGTPVSVLAQKRTSSGGIPARTPIPDRSGSRQRISRRSKSTEVALATPGTLLNGGPRLPSASPLVPQPDTPSLALAEDESEDELSPSQLNGETSRLTVTTEPSTKGSREEDGMDVDELSSPMQPNSTQNALAVEQAEQVEEQERAKQQVKRGRPRRIVLDEQDEAPVTAPAQPAKRERPAKPAKGQKPKAPTTSVAPTPINKRRRIVAEEQDEGLDELSPDKDRTAQPPKKLARPEEEVVEISDHEVSDEYDEPEPEEELEPTPRPAPKRRSPKQAHQVKPTSEKPQRKRHKFLGPKHAISVMRIKGSAVRGITVADTTRTILEETIDHRLNRMAEKMQSTQISTQRKELRSEINLALSFKESLNEKLMDLQDANDVLSTNFKKTKFFKRDNAGLRKEILVLQNSRQEVALEHDDVQMQYDAEKAKVEARNKLSDNIFDIEAAIQNGRDKARKEGREHEGPEIPLSMLLGMVSADVGSTGGGLLSNIKTFNGALERAAGWLEGRA
jgi:hypothetical protein